MKFKIWNAGKCVLAKFPKYAEHTWFVKRRLSGDGDQWYP